MGQIWLWVQPWLAFAFGQIVAVVDHLMRVLCVWWAVRLVWKEEEGQ